MSLEKKVALVTGGSRGIGRAIALELARAGADIIVTSRTLAQAEGVKAEIEALGRKCLAVAADVANPEQVDSLVNQALATFPTIDILVNNAGITRDQLFMRMKPEEWRDVMATNLDGMFYVTRAVIKGMVKARWGRIINISSVVGFTGNPGQVNYSATKAATEGFTKSLAKELGSRNITVNAVAPGFIATDMTKELTEAQQKSILEQVPLGRMGAPEEIAHAVKFLASDGANYISGTTLHVNGGMY